MKKSDPLTKRWTDAFTSCRGDEMQRIIANEGMLNINTTDGNNKSALLWAVSRRQMDIAKMLIDAKINVDIPDRSGNTALHYAAGTGNMEAVTMLVDAGANVNSINKFGASVMHESAHSRGDHADIVSYFADRGVAIDSKDSNGITPLYHAASRGNVNCMRLLLERGADPNAVDRNGYSVAKAAAEANQQDALTLLNNWNPEKDKPIGEENNVEI